MIDPSEEPSPLPFGLPPFGEITPEHCREALLAGMLQLLRAEPRRKLLAVGHPLPGQAGRRDAAADLLIEPAGRPPVFLMSATSLLISSL